MSSYNKNINFFFQCCNFKFFNVSNTRRRVRYQFQAPFKNYNYNRLITPSNTTSGRRGRIIRIIVMVVVIVVVSFSHCQHVHLPSLMSSMKTYCVAGKNGNRAVELIEYSWPAKEHFKKYIVFFFLHIKQIWKLRTVINTYIQQQQKQQRKEKKTCPKI